MTEAEFLKLSQDAQVRKMMLAIAAFESGGGDPSKINYKATNKNSGAGGAYQWLATYWPSYAKEAGVTGYPARAEDASAEMQDTVAYYHINKIFKQHGAQKAIILTPLTWFYPEAARQYAAGNTSYIDKPAPGFNNGLTFRQYAERVIKILLGSSSYEYGGGSSYKWGPLPICIGSRHVDVKKIEEIVGLKAASATGVFGTALQYFVMKFQVDHDFPVNGCWGDREVAASTITSSDGEDSVDYTNLKQIPLVVKKGKYDTPQVGLPAVTHRAWIEINNNVGGYLLPPGIQGWGTRATATCHDTGNALDLFLTDPAHHDMIVGWLLANASRLGIKKVISRRRSWQSSRNMQIGEYKGVSPHIDHIHISLDCTDDQG